jgi:DNA helicase-2/ATP-dependent DNA helicase PcrA
MKLTAEQRDAVNCNENLLLDACPGSGKTRAIISKLARVVDEVRGTSRAVACITYTNAAVHEIEARLRFHIQLGDELYFDVCTIHSFCLNHIFRPFCHLIQGYEGGFKVLTPDSDDFERIVKESCEKFDRTNLVYRDFEDFIQLRITAEGGAAGLGIERGAISAALAAEYWRRLRKEGFIDFANIIYHSLVLLRERPEILSYVSAKFAWILVDEFQDTSDLQVEILALIASRERTRFFLVGDPNQSIFGFAGARPDLAQDFARRVSARTDKQLTGNFRSSTPIISHANLLIQRNPRMAAVGGARAFMEQPDYQHGSSAFNVLTDHFLPTLEGLGIPIGNAAVLAPSWYSLFPLGRRLREYGVSIVGPGARPYRRNRQFAPLAEQICGYLMDARPESIPSIERSLFNTLLDITGRAHFNIFSYQGRVLVFRLLEAAKELQQTYMSAVDWLSAAAERFSTLIAEAGFFSPTELGVFPISVEEMKADMRNAKVDLNNLTIDELGIYASPGTALKLSTFHNAKGREFDAVAMIDLHEGKIPFWAAKSVEEFAEARRLFYVGVTRARRYLLYVTDDSGRRDGPTRFLKEDNGVGVC